MRKAVKDGAVPLSLPLTNPDPEFYCQIHGYMDGAIEIEVLYENYRANTPKVVGAFHFESKDDFLKWVDKSTGGLLEFSQK